MPGVSAPGRPRTRCSGARSPLPAPWEGQHGLAEPPERTPFINSPAPSAPAGLVFPGRGGCAPTTVRRGDGQGMVASSCGARGQEGLCHGPAEPPAHLPFSRWEKQAPCAVPAGRRQFSPEPLALQDFWLLGKPASSRRCLQGWTHHRAVKSDELLNAGDLRHERASS